MLTLSAILALAWKLLLPLLLLVAIADVLTQTRQQQIRRLYRSGRYSQRSLADRLGVTQYAIRKALA